MRVDGFGKVYAIADEDLDRPNDVKTSSVHFLRFEVPAQMRTALSAGAALTMGVDHPHYNVSVPIADPGMHASLVADLRVQ